MLQIIVPKKQGRSLRSALKMNHMLIEAEKPVVLGSLEDEKSFESAQVLIKQTRRINYIVFLPIFLNTVKNALKEGLFAISPNEHRNKTIATIKKLRANSGNMTLHNGPVTTTVKMDLVYGPEQWRVIRMQHVDIWGACVNAKGDLAINADPEVMIWAERVRNLHAKTHYPCIKTGCYMTFDVNLAHDRKYSCLVCQTDQCPKCQTAWCLHERMTCAQFKIRHEAEKLSDPYILEQLYSGELQACPKCNTLTHKADGCNKIVCESPGCGEFWCWGCGEGGLRTKYRDPYDHWTNRGCKAGSGVFAEDIESATTIRGIISKRNVEIFGKKIIPKPVVADKSAEIEERKVPAGLQTPPKAGNEHKAPGAPRKLPLVRGIHPVRGNLAVNVLRRANENAEIDDNAWVPYPRPARQLLADPVQIAPKAAGFLGGNGEIPIPNNVRVGDFLRTIPAELDGTDSDDDSLPDLVAELTGKQQKIDDEDRQQRIGAALLRKPPINIQEATRDPVNVAERKQRAEELVRDAERYEFMIAGREREVQEAERQRERNQLAEKHARDAERTRMQRLIAEQEREVQEQKEVEQIHAEQYELQHAQARVQNAAQNNRDAVEQKRAEVIERMIADGYTEEEAADFMFALDTQMEADMALARQLQNED